MLFYHYFVFTIIVITCMHNASGCIQVNNSQFDPGKRYTSLRVSVGKTIQLKSNIGSCRLWPPLIIKYCTFHVYKSAIQPEQGSTADAPCPPVFCDSGDASAKNLDDNTPTPGCELQADV